MIVSEVLPHQGGMPLSRIFSLLMSRWIAVLSAIVLCMGLAILGYLIAPAQYSSEAILALDVRKLQALPNESVVSPLPQESPVLRTELDIISSRSMAEKVLADLDRQGFDFKGNIVPSGQRNPIPTDEETPSESGKN